MSENPQPNAVDSRDTLRPFAVFTALIAIAGVACVLHAGWLRTRAETSDVAVLAVLERTRLPALSLSSSSRWLRHTAWSEPLACCTDVPVAIDTDPAGMFVRSRAQRATLRLNAQRVDAQRMDAEHSAEPSP